MAEKDSELPITEGNGAETENFINSPENVQTKPENATSDSVLNVEEINEKPVESVVEQEPSIEVNTSENCCSDNNNQESVELVSTESTEYHQESEEQGEEASGTSDKDETPENQSDESKVMGGKHPKGSTEEEGNDVYEGKYKDNGKGPSGENTDHGNRHRSNDNQGCRPKKDKKKPGIQRLYGGSGDERPTKERKNRNERWGKNNRNEDSGGEEKKNDQKGNKKKNRSGWLNNGLRDEREDYEYFWKSYFVYSQWYKCDFEVDGIKYNCAEQYMMHQKAVLMGDKDSAEVIMALDDPREMKQQGRYVENFDQELWYRRCKDIVEKGNMAKFSQNEELKSTLFSTYPKTLVEASPADKIWGIGLTKEDKRAWNKQTWKGQNLLGEILTKVRDTLMTKEGIFDPVDPNKAKEASESVNKSEETSVLKEDSEIAK